MKTILRSFDGFQWRSISDAELDQLKEWLLLRKEAKWRPEEARELPPAPACSQTPEGAAYLAFMVLWQDAPIYVAIGLLTLGYHFISALLKIARWL